MSDWTPRYARGKFRAQEVYVVTTGALHLQTNKNYITKEGGIPPCQDGASAHPDTVNYISKEIMKFILKAAVQTAGVPPELTAFAGPVINQGAQEVQKFIQNAGGDIKNFLETIGASKTYASCMPVVLIVPKGSTILSIDSWTDRRAKPPGSYKTGDKSFDTLPANQWERSVKEPKENNTYLAPYAAWRIGEDQAVVSAILINWSNTDDLRGRLQVFFDPPQEWKSQYPLDVQEINAYEDHPV